MLNDADQEHPLCARCAAQGKTCCQNTEIFVTLGDVRRIAAAGHGDDFTAIAPRAARVEDNAWDAAWSRLFAADGGRRILAHRPDGDCVFLDANGCRLPMGVRPLVCRLYPYDYNESTIKGVFGHLCPSPEGDNIPFLLAALEMNREAAEGWRKDLYREIREEFPES